MVCKKNITIVALTFATIMFMHAQNFIPKGTYRSIIGSTTESKQEEEKKGSKHYTIMPFVNFDNFLFANTGGFGCDFKYLRSSGLTLYGNLGFLFGKYEVETSRDSYGSFPSYNEKIEQSVFTFLVSLEALIGWQKTFAQKHTMAFALGLQGAYGIGMMEYIAAAFRIEYSYLITKKYGIHVSFTDGIGLGEDYKSLTFMNRVSLKAGPIIYF